MSADKFDLLILGKSGNGKSATANSILGQKLFSRQASCVSEVTTPSSGHCVVNRTQITVVDGLDISHAGKEADFTDVKHAMSLCKEGFSALLIVLKFGSRFGEEEVTVIETIKSIFGHGVLKDFGICVLAHGDNFKFAMEDEDEPFTNVGEWFQQQTGKVKDLYLECGQRCVLFDNITKNPEEMNGQIRDLYNIVEKLVQRNKKKYTLEDFKDAEECRKPLKAKKLYPTIKRETDLIIEQVKEKMRSADNNNKLDIKQLETLVKDLQAHMSYVNSKLGEEFVKAQHLGVLVNSLVLEIESKIRSKNMTGRTLNMGCKTKDGGATEEIQMLDEVHENFDMDWEIVDKEMTNEDGVRSRRLGEGVVAMVEEAVTNEGVIGSSKLGEGVVAMVEEAVTNEGGVGSRRLGEGVVAIMEEAVTNEGGVGSRRLGEGVVAMVEEAVTNEGVIGSRSIGEGVVAVVDEAKITVREAETRLLKTYRDVKSNLEKTFYKTGVTSKDRNCLCEAIETIDGKITFFHGNEEEMSRIKKMRPSGDIELSGVVSNISIQSKETLPTDPNEMSLLLIGSSCNGKSATANSILGRNAFKINSDTTSLSSPFEKHGTKIGEWTVNVVDGPGVDTSKEKHDVMKASVKSIKDALELCDYQFSALLIVLRYGTILTKQEIDTMDMIRGILGKDVFKKYGVCVVTHGDNFEYDMEGAETTVKFEDWYRTYDRNISDLLRECGDRFVRFNNHKTADSNVRSRQVEQLLSVIPRGEKYSKTEFLSSVGDFKSFTKDSMLNDIMPNTNQFLEDVRRSLQQLEMNFKDDKEAYCFELKKLLLEVKDYYETIEEMTGTSNKLSLLSQMVEVLAEEIKTKVKLCEQEIKTETSRVETVEEGLDPYHYTIDYKGGRPSMSKRSPLVTDRSVHSWAMDISTSGSTRASMKRKSDASHTLNVYDSSHSNDDLTDKLKQDLEDIRRKLSPLKKNKVPAGFSLQTVDEDLNEQGRVCELYLRHSPQRKEIFDEMVDIKKMVAEQRLQQRKNPNTIRERWNAIEYVLQKL